MGIQTRLFESLEKLGHCSVFPGLGQRSPRNWEYAKVSAPGLPLDILLQNAKIDPLAAHFLQEFFQGNFSPAVLRREQARIGAHPVFRQEKLCCRVYGLRVGIWRFFTSDFAYFLQSPDETVHRFAVIWIPRLCVLAGLIQRQRQLPVGSGEKWLLSQFICRF